MGGELKKFVSSAFRSTSSESGCQWLALWSTQSVSKSHASLVLEIAPEQCQAFCACGWISTITYFEEADLLRALHAHAVVTFKAYEN